MPSLDHSAPVNSATLRTFGSDVVTPTYARGTLRPAIVHIGVGGFHRAHLATYVDELCTAGNTDWSIVGAGVLPDDATMAEVLTEQDFLYTLISRGADETDVRIVGSIVDFVHAVDDPEILVARIADVRTQIVSMTVTEGGYPVDDSSGEFLDARCATGSTFDVLARGLDARRTSSGSPLTVMSCDNIMTNGQVARAATLGAAARIGSDLTDWIGSNVSFPNSMVDRITPATSQSDIDWLAETHGVVDRWPVVAEPFRQWVVEDDFAGDRLPLEELDVIVTTDIEPYELTKLRLLNAGHSCLAYLAALDGHRAVDAAMADPTLRRFVEQLLHDEAKPTLPGAAGIDLDDYITSLVERFSNPGVGDQISRLCLDGSAKFPKFLLPTITAQLDADGPIGLATLALAGWCDYLATGAQDPGFVLAGDPMLDTAKQYASASVAEPAAFLDFTEVFGSTLPASSRFVDAFVSSLTDLRTLGVQKTVTDAL